MLISDSLSTPSISDHLSLKDVIARLMTSADVDGIAEFGSRATQQAGESSDYDLLILVRNLPARVFQMVTTIDGRLADVVLVETETADQLLVNDGRLKGDKFDALFALKMSSAHILYDASGRLARLNKLVTSAAWKEGQPSAGHETTIYPAWFWQSFGLLHLERMSRSNDSVQLSAADMMFTACLAGTWRSYFDVRGIPWEGEKAAIRYWSEQDPGYLQILRQCLEISSREERLDAYSKLVAHTLEPIGKVFDKGETAVILTDPAQHESPVQAVLQFWNALFRETETPAAKP
jgi:predicted nucleotidyltransferase